MDENALDEKALDENWAHAFMNDLELNEILFGAKSIEKKYTIKNSCLIQQDSEIDFSECT